MFEGQLGYPPGPVPTMGQLHRPAPHWCWIYCGDNQCRRISQPTALALAPYVIRWGATASSDVLRRSARCTVCGHKGATLIVENDDHRHELPAVFPAADAE